MYQSAIAKFDKKTETFQTWSTPKEWDTDAGQPGISRSKARRRRQQGVDQEFRRRQHLPARSRLPTRWRISAPSRIPAPAGASAPTASIPTPQNNIYLLDFAAGNIVKVDAKTKAPTVYLTPTPNSRPRRGRVDAEGRLWFAEYSGNAIGMFDPKTEKISEWKVPTPWSAPYDAEAGRNGEAWTGSMLTDRVARLDIKSGQYIEYQLPHPTNIRRVYRRQFEEPGHALGRQQSRRLDRQGRAARLRTACRVGKAKRAHARPDSM